MRQNLQEKNQNRRDLDRSGKSRSKVPFLTRSIRIEETQSGDVNEKNVFFVSFKYCTVVVRNDTLLKNRTTFIIFGVSTKEEYDNFFIN